MLFGTSIVAALALAAAPAAAGNKDFHHKEPEVTTYVPITTAPQPTGYYPVTSSVHQNATMTATRVWGNGNGNGTKPGHYGNSTTLTGPNGQPTATLPVGGGGSGNGNGGSGSNGNGNGVGGGATPPAATASNFIPSNPGSKLEVTYVSALALSAIWGAFMVMA
ncbi:hypothetical protein VTN00DRAFT_5277 [Thermoascus crustaceus]|uniref:uncharacterized protein n=1 Tax=Thermoascus crustaceus TaxID=5088 RepID=UPI003743B66D